MSSRSAWLGQRIRLTANPNYWRKGEPICNEVVFTVFSDNDAAAARWSQALPTSSTAPTGVQASACAMPATRWSRARTADRMTLRLRPRRPFPQREFRQALNYLGRSSRDPARRRQRSRRGDGLIHARRARPSIRPTTRNTPSTSRRAARCSGVRLSPQEMSAWKLLVNWQRPGRDKHQPARCRARWPASASTSSSRSSRAPNGRKR